MKNGFLLVGLLIFYSFLSTTFCQSIRIGEVKEEDIVPRDDWGSCPLDSNFKNPIKVRKPLPFCSQYTDKACCDVDDSLSIKQTVQSLIGENCPSCYQMISDWKCAECHPNAGLFYVGEQSSIRFCEEYCFAVFEICKDIPLGIEEGGFYINEPAELTAEEWCEGKVREEGTCFSGSIPTSIDSHCKCEDHLCHLEIMDNLIKQEQEQKQEEKKKKTEL